MLQRNIKKGLINLGNKLYDLKGGKLFVIMNKVNNNTEFIFEIFIVVYIALYYM